MNVRQVEEAIRDQLDGDVQNIKLVSNGYHKVFSLERNGEACFVKVYAVPLPSAIDPSLEVRLLKDMERRQVQGIVRVVASGAVTLSGGRSRAYLVCTAARGDRLTLSEEDLDAFGAALATLHVQASASASALLLNVSPADYCKYASEMLAREANAFARVRKSLDKAAQAIERAGLEHAFIHGDVRIDNARRSEYGVTFFDFEQASQGPTAFDLSTVAWWLATSCDDEQHRLWSAFLSGYTRINDACLGSLSLLPELLIANEARALPLLFRVAGTNSPVWSSAIAQLADATGRYEMDRRAVLPPGLRGTDWVTQ
ncbi:homoserine kinase [Caballeronia pedi]|uniref:Homoserine kinase n=1 Tax=Caballeronia pedi TaxID=1777141 RepID=A0A158A1D4_9BURK|nr:phosphotransferase [Caballeronia pedi]SAK51555.1 homoserine kinase [Caballeronia pedi]